ncbi:CvpA family protein [Candidatus Poribacteria bacterium]|nr:CvpA family protein [Candidatus Poribacteria bacterium]
MTCLLDASLTMTKLDIVILIIVGIAGFSCYKAGFTRSVWGIFAIGAGLIVASQLWQYLALPIQKIVSNEEVTKWISIIVLIIITSIVTDAVFERIHRIFEKGILGWLNSLLGLAIGIASSILIISLLLHFLNPYLSDFFKDEIDNSLFASRLMELGDEVWAFGKENVKKHLESE